MAVTPEDRRYMAAALRLSRWHTGLTATNPSVAALVVRDGAIVGQAVTAPGGRPHAETQALTVAGDKARGATLYVTLEPCSHHGKTPPCANAIVEAGIARVVVSLTDPDPRVSGRGLAILRDAGITVESGVMEEEGRRALSAYLMRQTRGRPYVTLKLAVSADGMIGRQGHAPGKGQLAITGPAARAQSHVLRAETDAILVGIGTALADDPDLTCRLPGLHHRSPLRIVLDHHLALPVTSKLVRTAKTVPVLIATLPLSPPGSPAALPSPPRGKGARRADEGGLAITADPAAIPPFGLPAISPTRGEIGMTLAPAPTSTISAAAPMEDRKEDGAPSISPLVGEMPGRAEGGNLPTDREGDNQPPTPSEAHADTTPHHPLTTAGVEILAPESLPMLLAALAARGISSLLVEGGATVANSFLDAGLVDRILLFTGTTTVGEGGIESPRPHPDIEAENSTTAPAGFRLIRTATFGPDRLAEYERSS
jgi:diaminohydroxyphosphoribosylaminopyrimidine deaminase/5-amino-6-(5-phosphoribosylamino)uracil reductase